MEFCQIQKEYINKDDLVIGSILGDGCITKDGRIQIYHSIKQKDYVLWLFELFNKFFKSKIIYRVCKDHRNGKEYQQIGIRTNVTDYIKLMRMVFYKPEKTINLKQLKKLTPLGLAIWYMDDGSLTFIKKNGIIKGRQIYLCTNCFTYEENQIICDYFNETYNINCNIHKDHGTYRIWMNGENASKFLSIVFPYMPKFMYYKVCYRYFGYKSSLNLCGHKCEAGQCPYNIV